LEGGNFHLEELNKETDGRQVLKYGLAVARLQVLRVRVPPLAWTSVSCDCCVLWGRALCDRPVTRPEEP